MILILGLIVEKIPAFQLFYPTLQPSLSGPFLHEWFVQVFDCSRIRFLSLAKVYFSIPLKLKLIRYLFNLVS